jgi:alanine racemase
MTQVSIAYNTLNVQVFPGRIVENLKHVAARSGLEISAMLPVIKADAYGHGLIPTAQALAKSGVRALAAGTVQETACLRKVFSGELVSLLGLAQEGDAALAAEAGVTPVLYRFDHLQQLNAQGERLAQVLPVGLKFDTGMARLGFSVDDLPQVIETLRSLKNLNVGMVHSHLAVADEPEARDFTLEQGRKFKGIVEALRSAGFSFRAGLANSAGILAYPDLHFDICRPGISLYGGNPFYGTAWEEKGLGLKDAMEVTTKVLQVRTLQHGASISYGCTFTAPKDMIVALTAAGYADAFSRGLSSKGQESVGWMEVQGVRRPVLGRVCMQLTGIDISEGPEVREDDEVFLLGGEGEQPITGDELAGWWGTIPYEVFCLLGLNRRVEGGA